MERSRSLPEGRHRDLERGYERLTRNRPLDEQRMRNRSLSEGLPESYAWFPNTLQWRNITMNVAENGRIQLYPHRLFPGVQSSIRRRNTELSLPRPIGFSEGIDFDMDIWHEEAMERETARFLQIRYQAMRSRRRSYAFNLESEILALFPPSPPRGSRRTIGARDPALAAVEARYRSMRRRTLAHHMDTQMGEAFGGLPLRDIRRSPEHLTAPRSKPAVAAYPSASASPPLPVFLHNEAGSQAGAAEAIFAEAANNDVDVLDIDNIEYVFDSDGDYLGRYHPNEGTNEHSRAASRDTFDYSAVSQENVKYEVCTVCFEQFQEHDDIRQLPCSHLFHAECVDSWLHRGRTCPVCRRKILKRRRDTDSQPPS